MIRVATTLSRAAKIAAQAAGLGLVSPRPPLISPTSPPPLHLRLFCKNTSTSFNPVTLQMINYALSHARSQKSDEPYTQGLLVLEQCLSTQSDENSKAIVLLAMSTLFSERGNYFEAIDRLHKIQDLSLSHQ